MAGVTLLGRSQYTLLKVQFASGITEWVNSDRGFGISVPVFSSRNGCVEISPTNLIEIVR